MTKCDVIQDLLPLYCDDVVSEGSRALVSEHIKNCADCQELLEKMKSNVLPEISSTDKSEIGALKIMKRKIMGKNIQIAFISIACAIAVFCIVFFYHTPMSFDATNSRIALTEDGAIAIGNNGFDSFTGILVDDAFYFNVRATIFTRYVSPLFRGRNVGHGRYSFYDIGGGASFFTDRRGNVTAKNNWTIPSGMDITADEVNRVYYLQGNLHRFASDADAFERVRENAILVWER